MLRYAIPAILLANASVADPVLRKLSRSDHSEYVHGYHLGSSREASLNVSDLQTLMAAALRISAALDLLDPQDSDGLGVTTRDIAKALKHLKGEL